MNTDTHLEIYYHITWTTFGRKKCLNNESSRIVLHKYIYAILTRNKCHVYRINSVSDHVHIAFALYPDIALKTLMEDIQNCTTKFIKQIGLFEDFVSWQSGYGVFTFATKDKDKVIEYIKNQQQHHAKETEFSLDTEKIQILAM